ncbi:MULTISPECIES: adenylate/guanylate cyclase domain-containing protein [unclassified Rhizobium]|uniref:adenylate/guanylate cyclase domain-containing protein n=1 Tax=unclassified Rhizobium TaxID=2613769 RepID=UPI001C82F88A|nr:MULTISPECIES: adenylate/guanylate cyclase domain-containing protein [unclassified Rhizobium]MBX5212780.1 adenylate/guanylate cyclase domain-containing protein [Rhizobium sp. NLR9a]MBX5243049.1 adenylate/guanylate cyclase domain-containing protein [Rhizobium sp. NLR3b]MBX5274625.1 adenylate/guanylate cyclase domain-containing protein [Rhizobium sp. NLR13a]MBX5280732.1 adenylate/guanylate cyclase domain-containing protein [Rhizobium sp. NLR10a]MBX5292166.1 adenylate/guanylate cyclase domain-c
MSETRRKLTTIFCADVQDYTRLMGADEEGTLATLKRCREAMAHLIESHGGRVVNTWGDGLIAEFPSVVEAVRAAVDTQNELAGFNARRPSDGRMLFRIGINLGDVIVEGDDIYGDGVNIAARLQASAAPGGIVISSTVYDQVRNKVAVGFEFLGPLMVKNVEEGVPSYAVRIGDGSDEAPPAERPVAARPQPAAAARPQPAAATRPQPAAAVMTEARPAPGGRKLFAVLGVIAVVLIVINLLSWEGVFWARFPVLALAVVAALAWNRGQTWFDRKFATLAIVALGIIGINLFTWSGTFWAVWPILGIAATIGLRWSMRR